MILVTGAVGNVGRALVPLLLAHAGAVRVLVRKPDRYRPPGPGVEVCAGHFGAPETLPPALAGVHTVFLLSGVHPDMVALQCGLVDAAKAAGVRRIVKLSGMDAAPGAPIALGRWHGQVEAAIEAAGLDFTHLRPNIFMQNLLGQAAAVAAGGELRAALGDGRVSLIDVRDIAGAAARVLLEPGHERRSYTLTGPQAIAQAEVAAVLARATGRAVRYVPLTPAQARAEMLAARLPEWWADLLLELYAVAAAGGCSRVAPDAPQLLGRAPRDFAAFAADHAQLLRG
jgi:uncharacterized protein YbjT (DUF2867 family)